MEEQPPDKVRLAENFTAWARSPVSELARVLLCVAQIVSFIVNPNHSSANGCKLGTFAEAADVTRHVNVTLLG
jgi:hypothetical protein